MCKITTRVSFSGSKFQSASAQTVIATLDSEDSNFSMLCKAKSVTFPLAPPITWPRYVKNWVSLKFTVDIPSSKERIWIIIFLRLVPLGHKFNLLLVSVLSCYPHLRFIRIVTYWCPLCEHRFLWKISDTCTCSTGELLTQRLVKSPSSLELTLQPCPQTIFVFVYLNPAGSMLRGDCTAPPLLHGLLLLDAGGGPAALEQSRVGQHQRRPQDEALLYHWLG